MRYLYNDGDGTFTVFDIGGYSLADTLDCGQCFRFSGIGRGRYFGVVGNSLIDVEQSADGALIFRGTTEEELTGAIIPYFALDTDWDGVAKAIRSRTDSEWMMRAAERAGGIAILRQEPWEALASFIISQNNNIPRIKGIIRKLCRLYGKSIIPAHCPEGRACGGCGACYTFPTPEAILERPELLAETRMGFRDKYILDAARRVASGECDLAKVKEMDDGECEDELKKILGVGKKVASCVMLYGLGHTAAFPIDVWMKRAIDTYFGGHLDHTAFGEWAGVAQQYIFHYARIIDSEREEV